MALTVRVRHLICTFGGRQWQIKQVYVAIMLICSSHGTLGSKSELIVQAPPGVGRPSTILKDILLHMEPPWEGGTHYQDRPCIKPYILEPEAL